MYWIQGPPIICKGKNFNDLKAERDKFWGSGRSNNGILVEG